MVKDLLPHQYVSTVTVTIIQVRIVRMLVAHEYKPMHEHAKGAY